jgi:hypothetical protein
LAKNKEKKKKEEESKSEKKKLKTESPHKKFLLKSLSKEFLEMKNQNKILQNGELNNQVLNVQVSKFNESYHKKKQMPSFEMEEGTQNEDFLNSFSFGTSKKQNLIKKKKKQDQVK